MVIFFNLSPTSSHLYPLQVENCDSNWQLVVDEDDNFKFRLERLKLITVFCGLQTVVLLIILEICKQNRTCIV